MTSGIAKRTGVTVIALTVILGCRDVVELVTEPTGGGFLSVESEFSDDPISPGGSGGVQEEGLAGTAEETLSFFTAFQIDPVSEDTAGPKFVAVGDLDQDGYLDIVSAWNQSQPIQLHLQRRDAEDRISFRTITLAGTSPIAAVAGLELGQLNGDGWLDIVVLVKATGSAGLCLLEEPDPPSVVSSLDGRIIVFFNPADSDLIPNGDEWTQMFIENPFFTAFGLGDRHHYPGFGPVDYQEMQMKPELGGFTALVVAEINGLPGDDIVVTLNAAECELLGHLPKLNTLDLYINPGPDDAMDPVAWDVPVTIDANLPQIKDVEAYDVDADGDLDLVYTFTNLISPNVLWMENPLIKDVEGAASGPEAVEAGTSDGFRLFASEWVGRPIGTINTSSDIIEIGDVDGDGFEDVVVRSTAGKLVQWFRRPNDLAVQPEFPGDDPTPMRRDFPWQVYTLREFNGDEPEAVGLGDLTGDGRLEVVIAAEGAILWYDGTVGESVFDQWHPNTIIQDQFDADDPGVTVEGGGAVPPGGAGVTELDISTYVNQLLIVDLDGDGKNDILGTLDRRTGSGLSDDRLVWYRNTRSDE